MSLPGRTRLAAGAVLTALLAGGCASAADPAPAASSRAADRGRSVVVLGHSGATGYN